MARRKAARRMSATRRSSTAAGRRARRKPVARPARKKAVRGSRKSSAGRARGAAKRQKASRKATRRTMQSARSKRAASKRAAPKRAMAKRAAPKRATAKRAAPTRAGKGASPRAAEPPRKPAAEPRGAQPSRAAAPKPPRAARTATPRPEGEPRLNRERRMLADEERLAGAGAGDDRMARAARTGRQELKEKLIEHTEAGPELTGGDIDASWEDAYAVGDEAPGGDNPTPDQDRVDDIGRALGVEYADDEELKGAEKIAKRDRNRWELDPASSEDWPHDRKGEDD